MITRCAILLGTLIGGFLPLSALAATLSAKTAGQNVHLELTPAAAGVLAFTDEQSLWVVSAESALQVSVSAAQQAALGVTGLNQLSGNAVGARLFFLEPTQFTAKWQGNALQLIPSDKNQPLPNGRFSVIATAEGVRITGRSGRRTLRQVTDKSSDQSIAFDVATQPESSPFSGRIGSVQLMPTLAGMAFTNAGDAALAVAKQGESYVIAHSNGKQEIQIDIAAQSAPAAVAAAEPVSVSANPLLSVSRTEQYDLAKQSITDALSLINRIPVRELIPPAALARALVSGDVSESSPYTELDLGTALAANQALIPSMRVTPAGYHHHRARIMTQLAEAQNAAQEIVAQRRLVELALIYQRPEEALGQIGLLPTRPNGTPVQSNDRVLKAVALLAVNRAEEALPLLQEIGAPAEHRLLWMAVAFSQLEQDLNEALGVFTQLANTADSYPLWLRNIVWINHGHVARKLGNVAALERALDGFASYPDFKPPLDYTYLEAQLSRLKKQENKAVRLLAEVADQEGNALAYQAKYEFIKILLKRGELGETQAISFLEDLRFLWRGSDLEAAILLDLGQLYVRKNNARKALERWKMLTTYFPNHPAAPRVTKQMTDTFLSVFDPANLHNMDELGILGIYFDFRELTPPGRAGDEVAQDVARRLRELGLFDRAARILKDQIRYRVKDPREKGELGLLLAEINRLNFKPQAGLSALRQTDNLLLSPILLEQRELERVRLLMSLDQPLKAVDTLLRIDEGTQERLLQARELAWFMEDDQNMLLLPLPYDPSILTLKQHALALSNQGGRVALESFIRGHQKTLQQEGAGIEMGLLTAFNGAVSPTMPLTGTNDAIKQIAMDMTAANQFTEDYRKFRKVRERERRRRAVYGAIQRSRGN